MLLKAFKSLVTSWENIAGNDMKKAGKITRICYIYIYVTNIIYGKLEEWLGRKVRMGNVSMLACYILSVPQFHAQLCCQEAQVPVQTQYLLSHPITCAHSISFHLIPRSSLLGVHISFYGSKMVEVHVFSQSVLQYHSV